MDALFGEMIVTLRAAQQAVGQELAQIQLNPSLASARLVHLQESLGDFEGQTHALLEMMTDSNADAEPVNEVEELAEFFSDTEARIAAMMKAGRGAD